MTRTIGGTVKDGVIVPDASLPEGARVEIVLSETSRVDVPPELQKEFEQWYAGSDRALDAVDWLARGDEHLPRTERL